MHNLMTNTMITWISRYPTFQMAHISYVTSFNDNIKHI